MILKADSQEKVKTSRATTAQPSEVDVSCQSPVTTSLQTQSPQKERIGDEEGTSGGKLSSTPEAKELPNNPDVGSRSRELSHVSEGELFPVEQLMSRKQLSAGELSHDPDANGDTSSGNRTVVTSGAKARQACQGEGHDADATCKTLNHFILLPKSTEENMSSNSAAATRRRETSQSLKVAQPPNDGISLGKACAKSQLSEQRKSCRGRAFAKREKGPRR